jgi:hypothetical protein
MCARRADQGDRNPRRLHGRRRGLAGPAPEGLRQTSARLFRRLQSQYAQRRAAWLAQWLENELLGGLLGELRQGAEVPASREFVKVEECLAAF